MLIYLTEKPFPFFRDQLMIDVTHIILSILITWHDLFEINFILEVIPKFTTNIWIISKFMFVNHILISNKTRNILLWLLLCLVQPGRLFIDQFLWILWHMCIYFSPLHPKTLLLKFIVMFCKKYNTLRPYNLIRLPRFIFAWYYTYYQQGLQSGTNVIKN